MSETCIVCLGDLESANALPHPAVRVVKSEDDEHGGLMPSTHKSPTRSDDQDSDMIAHLLPCGHNLHDECLKPWVERANSCPICRQNFNKVELSTKIGGPIVSTYSVSDRTQIAEVDPSMLIEDYDEEVEDQPCLICGEDDNEEQLLACDGCDAYYHTYCVDLEEVPIGHWYCESCETQRAIESVCPTGSNRPAPRSHHPADRRTRGQQRQVRSRNQANSSSWARVWQSVWDNLNLDLDFPFDEGSDAARIDRAQRAASQRRDFQQWERRFQVAERQGGGNRFRDTASTLLDLHATREHPAVPEPESREEIRAWNAFEKAKEIELDPNPKRKRKSATTSPSDAEPHAQPQRPLKRPRTRRTIDNVEGSINVIPEAFVTTSSRTSGLHNVAAQDSGPSFLQSMLREIETSATPEGVQAHQNILSVTGHSSPQPSSPGASPTTSNHPSPRARSTTPPPSAATRPGSPFSLTSKVEPIYPPAEFSPMRSPTDTSLAHRPHNEMRQSIKSRRRSRPHIQRSSPIRSEDTSPTRATMPLSTKTDLQRMVSTALAPHYQSNTVSKDQYTDINRNVSRLLYEKVGDAGSVNGEARKTWERLASDEVAKAVLSLKASS
ncbi:MAG: PHD and RING finger domain-containing protein 1 [Alectoria fallacina]|uniref:PHD and RING finger domain-containing protein 1 n=1 Tax=Alectoria fallacina TaxID=1903189 RepID=A0A8H3J4D0_9LECA|nr:MAG: PHD and RING finger domain-containing protein 1 [Alectoria fallacina]